VLVGRADEVALVEDFAVVVGLFPPGNTVSEIRIIRPYTTYRYRERIGSSSRPGLGMCIRRHMFSRHSSLVRRIAHMLGFVLRLHSLRW
jgi:hypothetical protein